MKLNLKAQLSGESLRALGVRLSDLVFAVYLRVFRRPDMHDDAKRRSASVFADFFAISVVYNSIDFAIQFSRLTSLGIQSYLIFIGELLVIRYLAVKGKLFLSVVLYLLSVLYSYWSVTEALGYFEHLQASNVLLVVAFATLTMGARIGGLTTAAILVFMWTMFHLSRTGVLTPLQTLLPTIASRVRTEWTQITSNVIEMFIFCWLVRHHIFSQLNLSLDRETLIAKKEHKARKEADKANGEKSRFLAAASHDLRQPVSALSLNFESYVAAHPEAKTDGTIKDMAASIETLERMLDSILTVSKLQAKVVLPTVQVVSINRVLQRCFAANSAAARSKNLQLRLRATDLQVETDPDMLFRAVNNLVNNAVKYTEQGGILIGVRKRFGGHAIFVMDSGIGIPEESIAQIFEEFTMLMDPSRKSAGSGLGLTIVKRTADLLGMKVHTESKLGKGSTFYLELPKAARRQISVSNARADLSANSDLTEAELRGLVVAVIDDVESVRTAICRSLQGRGLRTLDAGSWAEMVPLLDQATPDLLITDYQLDKDESGYDVVLAARKAISATLPCFIITGDTSPELVRELAGLNVETCYKPLSTEGLITAIRNQMSKART